MLLWYREASWPKEQVSPLPFFCSCSLAHFDVLTRLAHARMSGPFGNRGSNESREQTIANGEFSYYYHMRISLLPLSRLTTPISKSEDTASGFSAPTLGGCAIGGYPSLHARRGTPIHQRPEEHECSRRLSIRCLSAEGDSELHVDRLLGLATGA